MAALERRLFSGVKETGSTPSAEEASPSTDSVPAGKGHPMGTDREWQERETQRGRKHLEEQAKLVARLTGIPVTLILWSFELGSSGRDEAGALRDRGPTRGPSKPKPGMDSTDEAHLGVSATSKSRHFDWDSHTSDVSPLYPEEWTAEQKASSSARDVFNSHFDRLLAGEFGAGTTRSMVESALASCDWARATAAAGHLRSGLFRAEQQAAILTLNVDDSARYAGQSGSTYCNVYAHDLVQSLGGYLPRVWWTGDSLSAIDAGAEVISKDERSRRKDRGESLEGTLTAVWGKTVTELNANQLRAWLEDYGGFFGWKSTTDIDAAQSAANGGKIVLLSAKAGKRGHVTVIASETGDHQAERDPAGNVRNPLESQAGYNSNYGTARGGDQWWQDSKHSEGAAFILESPRRSNLLTPEEVPGLI
jgi:hypothetical protein